MGLVENVSVPFSEGKCSIDGRISVDGGVLVGGSGN